MPYCVSSKAKEPYVIWMDSSIDLRDQGYDEVDRSGVYVLWINLTTHRGMKEPCGVITHEGEDEIAARQFFDRRQMEREWQGIKS